MSARVKIRLRFAKHGRLRWIGHHDVLRCLERLLRRARIPIAQTQGFNPHPRLSFALALALGIEGRREVVDFDLAQDMVPDRLLETLGQHSPEGLDWLEANLIPQSTPPPEAIEARYSLAIALERRPAARLAITQFLAAETWPYTRNRPGRERSFDLRARVIDGDLDESGTLRFSLKVEREGSARPEEVVEALGLSDLTQGGGRLVREDVVLKDRSPLSPAPLAVAPTDQGEPSFAAEPSHAASEAGLELVQSVFIGQST